MTGFLATVFNHHSYRRNGAWRHCGGAAAAAAAAAA